MKAKRCRCLKSPQVYDAYEDVRFVGIDETKGRYGEVEILRCRNCGALWLKYFVEYEAFRSSGRYFMGLINEENAQDIKPEEAVDYLRSLEWYLYGGSFFKDQGRADDKDIYVDG